MAFGRRVARWFQRRNDSSIDSKFVAASGAYKTAVDEVDGYSVRALDAHEGSKFILEQTEFEQHQRCVRACHDRLRTLAEELDGMAAGSGREKAEELVHAACLLHMRTLLAFEKARTLSALVAERNAFDAKCQAMMGNPEASLREQVCRALAHEAERGGAEVEDMKVDLGVWRNYCGLRSAKRPS